MEEGGGGPVRGRGWRKYGESKEMSVAVRAEAMSTGVALNFQGSQFEGVTVDVTGSGGERLGKGQRAREGWMS